MALFYKRLAKLGIEEAIILSSTDISEIILCLPENVAMDRTMEIIKLLSAHASEPRSKIESQTYILNGHEAIKHVFAVASALDNLVIGDKKLKEDLHLANQFSIENNASSEILVKLIKTAQEAANRISLETQIEKRPISITAAAVQVARDLHGNLEHSSGLLIGGGEMGKNIAFGIRSAGLKNLIVSHESPIRAENISKNLNCHVGRFDELNQLLIQSDVIITSTNTRSFVLNKKNLKQAISQRRRKPIFIIDTGVPRDVDPDAETLEDIFLYTLDDLEKVTKEGRESRANEAELARKIIEDESLQLNSYIAGVENKTPAKNNKLGEIERIRDEILQEKDINAEKATKLLVSRIEKFVNIYDD